MRTKGTIGLALAGAMLAGASGPALARRTAAAAPPSPARTPGDTGWQQNGQPAEPDPGRAMAGDFGAMLVVTPDLNEFWKAWAGPTPPRIVTTERIGRKRPVMPSSSFRAAAPGRMVLAT